MTITEQVARLLAQLGLGTYDDTGGTGNIFLTQSADSPDVALTVARYGGIESDSLLGYDQPTLQIRVRGTDADASAPEALAQQIYDQLHGMMQRVLPGGTYLVLCIGTNGGPVYIGPDLKNRFEWTVNFRMEIRNQSAQRQ
jgi:hypothetical protein